MAKKTFNIKKGALHEYLGMSPDKQIPMMMLHSLANDMDKPLHVRKMANFALNSRKFKHD